MIKIAIIDDEPVFLQRIKQLTEDYFHLNIISYMVKTYQTAKELIWDIDEDGYFDIYLIDIEMPEINGMDLANIIREKYEEPYIIFITSHLEYSLKGYEYNAWRYITKDAMNEFLPLAFDGLIEKLNARNDKFYIIELRSRIAKIPHSDIYYLHKIGKYTILHTKQGEIKERKAINKIYGDLGDNKFIFTDRSYIVNLNHVMSMEDHSLILRNGDEVPISIPQFGKVKKAIIDYWSEEV